MKNRLNAITLISITCFAAEFSYTHAATDSIIKPRAVFSLYTNGDIWHVGPAVLTRGHDPLTYAIAIFDVPQNATNLDGFIRFDPRPLSIGGFEGVFVFDAPGAASTNIATLPTFFVDSQNTDVSPWIHAFAGRRIGVQLRATGPKTDLGNFELHLVNADTYDAPPHITLLDPSPSVLETNTFTITADITDSDGGLNEWRLLYKTNIYSWAVFTSETFATSVPSGTIRRSVTIRNLAPGPQQFGFETVTGTNVSRSLIKHVQVLMPGDRAHRWLGSFGNSGSFYVVDAAGRAHVWGRNESAQLGLGFKSDYVKHPVTLLPPEGVRFLQIASNTNTAAAVTDQLTLCSWGGWNTQIRTGVTSDRYFRVAMTDGKYVSVGVDGDFTGDYFYSGSALDVKGGADIYYAKDRSGRLGYVQLPTNALPVLDYSPSYPLSYAIGSDSNLYSWQPKAQNIINEIHIPGVNNWRRVAASPSLTLAIDDFGRLWEWGIGFSPSESFPAAHLVKLSKSITNWLDIAVTSSIAMALSAEGELYAWGRGAAGMWADSTATIATEPELVRGLPNLLDPKATDTAAEFLKTSVTPTTLNFQITAPAGSQIPVQTSTDLIHWNPVKTLQANPGITSVDLPLDPTASQFFRIAP